MESYEGFILIGGYDVSKKFLTTCEVYNQDFDIPPLPLPLSGHITEVVEATGSIIVAGGQTGDNKISDKTFLLPSLSSKTWKEMGRMAEPVYCAASATIGDNLLVIGGITDNRDKNILVTDKIQMLKLTDANPTWAVLQNKYWPKQLGEPGCVVWNESLILLSNERVTFSTPVNKLIDTSEALQDIDWDISELPGYDGYEFGGPPRGFSDFGPSIAVVNEDVVAVLGRQVWRKTEGGEWKKLSSLPEEKHCWPSIVTRNNRLEIAGGAVGIGGVASASASVFELDESSNSWEEAPPLKQPRCFHSTVKLPPGTLHQNQNPLNIIKSLLGTLHLYTNITDETRQYIRKRAITSIDSMEKLKEPRTGRLEPRLSLLILFAALLTETELGEDLKRFLEIDPTVFEQFNPETVKAYIGTVKLSKTSGDVETTHKLITPEAPETTLYISGLQGSGKTSLGLSMKDEIVLSENIKCEGKTRENTQLMDQYQVPLRMKTKLKIDVEQYITEDANELPTNLSILKINPTEQAGDIQSSTILTEGIEMSNRSSNILTSEIAVNVIDIGGHEEYAVVTKSLFKNESVYLVNFDGSKYTEKTYRRHIGSFLETIVVESSGAAIALVSNKCDAGKQTYTKDEENREKILQEAKKDLAHWCNKLDKRAYLFDKIFVVSCAPNKTLPLLKDVTRCCKRNISPNEGIEDLKECLAKLYLDTTDTTIGKEGEKVIPVEMAPLSFYREFHNKMKEEEKQNKFDDLGSEYWLEPIKLDKAKQIFKLLESEKLRELKNKEISEENLELDWMIQAINGLPMESERIETQENDSFTSNQDTDNGNTSYTGIQDTDNLISTSISPNPSTPSLTTQSTVVRPSVKNMSPGQRDKKEVFPEGESSESANKSFELAIKHLQNAGKLIILDKEFRPGNYVFPDPMKLINSFKIMVNHTLNNKLKPRDNEIWNFNEDIQLDDQEKFRSMILNNGFMAETVVDLLFKCQEGKNHHLFHQDVVKQLLSKLCLTCKWEFEGWDGWLIPSLLRKSLNECKSWAKLDYMGFGELEYLRANIVEKSIETPLVGVGFGHRMMINILKNESDSPFGSLKVGEMAIQPLERRDPGDIFLFIGCHPENENDIQIVLIEEERILLDVHQKKKNYDPHVRVLKMFVKNDSNKEILQKKFISLQKALNETLNPFKSTSERNEMNEAGQNNEDNELEHVIKVTPQNNIMRIISNGKKHLWTDYIKTETFGQDDRVGERMFKHLPDPRPPPDEGKGLELCKTLVKSLFMIVGIIFSCLTIEGLRTNQKVQEGKYRNSWIVLLAILFAPLVPNVIILFHTTKDLKNPKKWALVLLHLTGPFLPFFATCLWLVNKKSNEFWHFKIKTGINYGIWESFCKLIFSSFAYSFGIIPFSPLQLKDADGNKITLPATAFTMTVISVLILVYSVWDSWTTYPPYDGLRRDDDGGENNDTKPLLDAHLENENSESNQLPWYKKYLYVSGFFSIFLAIFRVLGIFAVTIYLSWWYYICGLLSSFVVYLILFVWFGPLCENLKSLGFYRNQKMHYSPMDWFWIFFLLVPIPTAAFSKRATHTFFLFHNLFTNAILLILLYIIPYKVFSDKTHIMSDQLMIPSYLVVNAIITCAALMPLVTYWHCWITWAHTHRRILPKFPQEKEENANCMWFILRKFLVYLGCIFILALSSGLIIFTVLFCETQNCVTDRCYTAGVPCHFDDDQLVVKRDSNGQLSARDTSALYKWENNTIPFYFTSTSEKDKKLFQNVMARIEGKTCFKFEEKTKAEDTDVHILEIETLQKSCTSGCRGLVGSVPFSKKIQLTSWTQVSDSEDCKLQCEGFVLHELMHVLGVGHAHRRSDRDDFITVNEANVMSLGLTDQFKKCEKCTIFSDIPYDCNSITHFGTHFLNSNDTKLMKPKNHNTCTLKQDANFNDGMEGSVLDWKLLNIIGNCSGVNANNSVTNISANFTEHTTIETDDLHESGVDTNQTVSFSKNTTIKP